MASMGISFLLFLSVLIPFVMAEQTYIVHMKNHDMPSSFNTHQDWYSSILQSLSCTPDSLLYSYNESYPGFAASLEPAQAQDLRQSKYVLGVYVDSVYQLHTTRSPEFIGLDVDFGLREGPSSNQSLDKASRDVIIGVLDSGVWLSKSFNDSGMPEVPKRWRGECETDSDFITNRCNKKLIGVRSFSKSFLMSSSAKRKRKATLTLGEYGCQGTHTASTASGSQSPNGIVGGMPTYVRLAAYKVCWLSNCFASDILAAIDRAIHDGVDVLSMSLVGGSGWHYNDTIAIGELAAMEKGVFVDCTAWNSASRKASLADMGPRTIIVVAVTLVICQFLFF